MLLALGGKRNLSKVCVLRRWLAGLGTALALGLALVRSNGVRAGVFVLFLKATSSQSHKAWAFYRSRTLLLRGQSTAALSSQDKGECSVLMDFSPRVSEEYAFSGILHVLPLNVSPESAQRLGVVPAFWELGVVTLHGTEVPRAWGGRMLETTRPGVPLQGKGGGSESPRFYLGTLFHTGVSHSCISKWQVLAPALLPKHPGCMLDAYLRMTWRVQAFVTSDASLWTLLFATFLRTFVVQESKPCSPVYKHQNTNRTDAPNSPEQ